MLGLTNLCDPCSFDFYAEEKAGSKCEGARGYEIRVGLLQKIVGDRSHVYIGTYLK